VFDPFLLRASLGRAVDGEKYRGVVALSKKNPRAITVGDTTYRWAFSMDSGFATIVLQHGSGTGQRVEAQTWEWDGGDTRILSPAAVAKLVTFAQEQGWNPMSSGPPLRLRNIDQAIDFS